VSPSCYSDKTGTLTDNVMSLCAFSVGARVGRGGGGHGHGHRHQARHHHGEEHAPYTGVASSHHWCPRLPVAQRRRRQPALAQHHIRPLPALRRHRARSTTMPLQSHPARGCPRRRAPCSPRCWICSERWPSATRYSQSTSTPFRSWTCSSSSSSSSGPACSTIFQYDPWLHQG